MILGVKKNRVSGLASGPGELNREVSRLGDVGTFASPRQRIALIGKLYIDHA